MSKLRKISILLMIVGVMCIATYFIYQNTKLTSYSYLALGDSVPAGVTPYGGLDYSYPDYIRDYLASHHMLKTYSKEESVGGYTVDDLKYDINNNKKITVNKKIIGLKEALANAELITLSIGANDFLNSRSSNLLSLLDRNSYKNELDTIGKEVDELIDLIKTYAKHAQIIIVGYYNPIPRLTTVKTKVDEFIEYSDQTYESVAKENNIMFVKVSDAIAKDNEYLPNPTDIHPSKEGHKVISERIIAKMEKEIIK